MKIEVIKPQDEVKWNYPCKGIHQGSGLVVGFTEEGAGCVLEQGKTNYELYSYEEFWDMDVFTPIKEKGNNLDWNNTKFPILVKGIGRDIFTIDGFDEVDNSVSVTTFNLNHNYICEEREKFSSEKERNEWLKSLEILPKGTEIKITF